MHPCQLSAQPAALHVVSGLSRILWMQRISDAGVASAQTCGRVIYAEAAKMTRVFGAEIVGRHLGREIHANQVIS